MHSDSVVAGQKSEFGVWNRTNKIWNRERIEFKGKKNKQDRKPNFGLEKIGQKNCNRKKCQTL